MKITIHKDEFILSRCPFQLVFTGLFYSLLALAIGIAFVVAGREVQSSSLLLFGAIIFGLAVFSLLRTFLISIPSRRSSYTPALSANNLRLGLSPIAGLPLQYFEWEIVDRMTLSRKVVTISSDGTDTRRNILVVSLYLGEDLSVFEANRRQIFKTPSGGHIIQTSIPKSLFEDARFNLEYVSGMRVEQADVITFDHISGREFTAAYNHRSLK